MYYNDCSVKTEIGSGIRQWILAPPSPIICHNQRLLKLTVWSKLRVYTYAQLYNPKSAH
ncbi:hypothetical protein AVEN_169312-1, partial [Araneus ventricosus]